MKRFFMSFLGSLAAFWVTIIIVSFTLLLGIGIMAAKLVGEGGKSPAVEKHSVLHLNLDMVVNESPSLPDLRKQLMSGSVDEATKLSAIVNAIKYAADDNNIDGLFIDCNGITAGAAQLEAIAKAIVKFKESGKWVWAYGDQIDQADYLLASCADSIFINPSGIIDVRGLTMFNENYRRLLDKLGVKMQVVKVGTYKSAVEPFILDAPSEANKEQERLFLGNVWSSLRARIAEGRNVAPDSVDSWVRAFSATRPAEWYVSNKLADAMVYRHEMISRLKAATGVDADKKLRLVALSNYIDQGAGEPSDKGKATIAVYYAEGDIVDANKGYGEIASYAMVNDLERLARNEDIDALVIRVNSPGGSAYASEQIWEAVRMYKEQTGNPVYVSMGDYAASGGYYISCGADKIYAQPVTLTGSIGIFGLIPDLHGLTDDKLGITVTPVSTHPGYAPINPFLPMTPEQQASMQANVNRGYELFVKRVADGRKMTVEQVKAVAEGRVWDGKEAKARGLVDELGGLDRALADMAEHLNVESYAVKEYPVVDGNRLTQILQQLGMEEASAIAAASAGSVAELVNDPSFGPMLQTLNYARRASGVQAYQRPIFVMQ